MSLKNQFACLALCCVCAASQAVAAPLGKSIFESEEGVANASAVTPAFLAAKVTKIMGADGRASTIIAPDGEAYNIQYDGLGRVGNVTIPSKNFRVKLTYASDNAHSPSIVEAYDLATGKRMAHGKLPDYGNKMKLYGYDDDDDFPPEVLESIEVIGSALENPYDGGVFGVVLGVAGSPPPPCSADSCAGICDAGFASALALCTAYINPVAVGICGAVALAAWGVCRNTCSTYCH